MPANKPHGFDGKVAVVMAAGEGLGRQHVLELANRGAKHVISTLDKAV
jgi:NAD(P)-dependent dehydrogenase (short-subunit alcohol dehydrogenase family)